MSDETFFPKTSRVTLYRDLLYNELINSEVLNEIMSDLLIQLPELFKTLRFSTIKEVVCRHLCDGTPLVVEGRVADKFNSVLSKYSKSVPKVKNINQETVIKNKIRTLARNAMKLENVPIDFIDMLGCSSEYFRGYIQDQFVDGMTWENYGMDGWHIDPIKPLCSFNLYDPEELKKSTHYTNLRPLWSEENIKKAKQDRKLKFKRSLRNG